jgi:hypothetical protein
MTSVVRDNEAFIRFIDNVILNKNFGSFSNVDLNTVVWYGLLMVRSKYCKNVDRPFPIRKFVIRNFDRFLEEVDRYNPDHITFNNIKIHSSCLALYVTLNPRNPIKAAECLSRELVKIAFNNDIDKMKKLDHIAYTCYHKSPQKCARAVIDIDLNCKNDYDYYKSLLENIIEYARDSLENGYFATVRTRGGLHIYVDLQKLEKKHFLFKS